MANNQLQNLNTSLVLAQTELSKLQEEVTFAREIRSGARDYSSIAQVMQNYAIESLAKDISTAQNKVDELFERYGEKHPKMIAAPVTYIERKSSYVKAQCLAYNIRPTTLEYARADESGSKNTCAG